MRLEKKIQFIFPGILLTLIFTVLSFGERPQEESIPQIFLGGGRLILIIIDLESFFCPLCLESFKAFSDALLSNGQEHLALGVLTFQNPSADENIENQTKIVERKLRGFIAGNNIKFPILLDKLHVFDGMRLKDSDIILFDITRSLVKKYKFPLTKKQFDEILLR